MSHLRSLFCSLVALAGLCVASPTDARADVLVTSGLNDQVLRYDDAGNFVGVFAEGAG